MHVTIVFVKFCRITFGCESCETFFENVYTKRLVGCDYYVDPKVEFMTVNKQWVRDVTRDYTGLIYIEFIYVLNNMNTSALRCICWLYNPKIALGLI